MSNDTVKCAAVIVAAGKGERAGGPVPKQYAKIGGKSVLRCTTAAFAQHPRIGDIVVVINPDFEEMAAAAVDGLGATLTPGGATRQASVFGGLMGLAHNAPDIVLIHDGARPFVSQTIIDNAIDGALKHGGAIAGIPVSDTVKRTGGNDHQIESTIPRDRLWRAQTPQAFRYAEIVDAHRKAAERSLTDDAAVAEAAGMRVVMTEGAEENFKITTAADLERAGMIADMRANAPRITIVGNGFDVHAFQDGDHVTLCGVRIAHDRALKGHSDADVALHALTDAILGAVGAGDIGQHFPDSDPQWRGAASATFLHHAINLVEECGGRLNNLDLTIICEKPKLQPHRDAMMETLVSLTSLPRNRIGLKATTTEKLGFTGRGEGIAAQAVVALSLPEGD